MGAFDTTVGVLLLGLFFNTFLYGLVCYQFIVYWSRGFNDNIYIKAVVATLFVVDTTHSAVAVYQAWEMCVTNFANPASLAFVTWPIPFTAVATSVAALITQGFLGNRVRALTKSWILFGVIMVLSFLGFVFGIIAGVKSGIIAEVAKFGPLAPLVTCWLTFQTAADLLVTFSLTWVLSRSRTGFRKTDTIINRLIRGAIQTGFFASAFALADLFSFLLHRDTNLYAMFAFPIGRIYTNTLLDTLNSRTGLKDLNGGTMDVESTNPGSGMRFNSYAQNHQLHAINVQKSVEVHHDGPDGKYLPEDFVDMKRGNAM